MMMSKSEDVRSFFPRNLLKKQFHREQQRNGVINLLADSSSISRFADLNWRLRSLNLFSN